MFNISEHFGLEWLGCCPPSWLGSSAHYAHTPKFSHRGHRVGQSFTLHHSAQQLQFTGRRQLWLRLQPHLQDLATSLSLLDLDPSFQEIFSFSLPLQLPEPACIIYPLFQLLGLKRVAHHGGQHARDHCATRPPSHFLQRLAQTNPHCAIGGCSHGGSLKPAEERTWQQAFGRCWAAAGPLLGCLL